MAADAARATPCLGVIGGTGLDTAPGLEVLRDEAVDTPWGAPSAPVQVARLDGWPIAFVPRHGRAHEYPPHAVNYRANLWALRRVGVARVIAINAVGSIAQWFEPGRLALPEDLVDYTWGRPHSCWNGPDDDPRHVEFTRPVDPVLRARLIAAGRSLESPPLDGGVYGVTQGPRLETAAEVRRLRRDGCDMVGMTLMPEAAIARELGLDYACIAFSVNWAAGCGMLALHDEMAQHLERGAAAALALLRAALPALASGEL